MDTPGKPPDAEGVGMPPALALGKIMKAAQEAQGQGAKDAYAKGVVQDILGDSPAAPQAAGAQPMQRQMPVAPVMPPPQPVMPQQKLMPAGPDAGGGAPMQMPPDVGRAQIAAALGPPAGSMGGQMMPPMMQAQLSKMPGIMGAGGWGRR